SLRDCPDYAQRRSRSIPESVRARTFTFGSQRTQLNRSSQMSFLSELLVSTVYAPLSSSCRLSRCWTTFEHDGCLRKLVEKSAAFERTASQPRWRIPSALRASAAAQRGHSVTEGFLL